MSVGSRLVAGVLSLPRYMEAIIGPTYHKKGRVSIIIKFVWSHGFFNIFRRVHINLPSILKVVGDSKKKMKETDNRNLNMGVRDQFHIFIKTISRKSVTMRVWDGDLVQYFKENIREKLGIPPNLQILVYSRNSMKEGTKLWDYGIERDSTIFLN